MSDFKSWQILGDLPVEMHTEWFPKPLLYPQNSNSVVLVTDSATIYKYDLDTNDLQLINKYTANGDTNVSQFIVDNTLYLFRNKFISMDLTTNTLNYNLNINENNHEMDEFTKCVTLNNTVHILSKNMHFFNFNHNKQTLTKLKHTIKGPFEYAKLIYIPLYKQLMILGGDYSDNIFQCQIGDDLLSIQYKLSDTLKMPVCVSDERSYDILAFGDIIFVFYSVKRYIWCLDLLQQKWFKSHHIIPEGLTLCSYFIKDNNDDIHILSTQQKRHFKINIHQLIPMEMYMIRRKYYEPLVIGFIKQKENTHLIPTI
eukprot:225659_1